MEKFKKRLKSLMEERGVSQIRLGEALDISQSTISKWFMAEGNHSPTLQQIINITRFLEVNSNWLLLGEGQRDFEQVPNYNVVNNQEITQSQTMAFDMQIKLIKEIHDCRIEILKINNEIEKLKLQLVK